MDKIYESYQSCLSESSITPKRRYTLKKDLNAENNKVANDFDFKKGDVVIVTSATKAKNRVIFKSDDKTENNSWATTWGAFADAI